MGHSSANVDPDAELVQRMSRGDRAALASLYERHAPRFCAPASHILGRADEAEDLLHDVFIEAWRHAGDYVEAKGSVFSWLCVRTRSRAIDRRRSIPRALRLESFDGASALRDAFVEGDSDLGPDRAKLEAMLLALSREEREVLALGYFEGLSSREIGERVGIPLGTVKSRTRSALLKLRERLAEKEGRR